MNMILDTMLTGPEAILIIICTGFILGTFRHAGNKMSEDDTYDADYLDDTGYLRTILLMMKTKDLKVYCEHIQ